MSYETRSNIGDGLSAEIARDIIIGMARPINQHLVKLIGFDFPPQSRDHFRRELRSWLDEIQRIRLNRRREQDHSNSILIRCLTIHSAA
jgi:hypothetical protein